VHEVRLVAADQVRDVAHPRRSRREDGRGSEERDPGGAEGGRSFAVVLRPEGPDRVLEVLGLQPWEQLSQRGLGAARAEAVYDVEYPHVTLILRWDRSPDEPTSGR
jgi:hypothetical protein